MYNPVWYAGSLAMGVTAGLLGDKWNLGFLEETEYQVEAHLNEHLESLPAQDAKSRAIVSQMREDEVRHAETAHELGAAKLPLPVKGLMHVTSLVMKKSSYWVIMVFLLILDGCFGLKPAWLIYHLMMMVMVMASMRSFMIF